MNKCNNIEHIPSDLQDLTIWLGVKNIDDIELSISMEPIDKFISQIKEMESTYDEFPKDEKRTKKIEKLLNNGSDLKPIYVEKDDLSNFVMEGRHRMVAFLRCGYTNIPVCRVNIKQTNHSKLKI